MTDYAEAFLSYTRLDDEYFGGAITSLRQSLELGVRVVTGDRSFKIFQDLDGIEFGQKWKERLAEAISTSSFLIPIVTPLFFNSNPCRDELKQFIEHEKSLGRNDLILPIYFVTAPVLERPELLKSDPLATEIGSRQRCDWRLQADLPPNDFQLRRAARELAEAIATAIARATSARVPAGNRNDATARATFNHVENLGLEREPQKPRKVVLWVDDKPDNNSIERRSMAAYNLDFILAQSTDEALTELRKKRFDAIISDMSRPPDGRAGYTLLKTVRDSGDLTPYFIYAGSSAPGHLREAYSCGAQGTTDRGDELLQMLLQALNVSGHKEVSGSIRPAHSAEANIGRQPKSPRLQPHDQDEATQVLESRRLDAAVAAEIPIGKPTHVFAQIRLANSEGLRIAIDESHSALPSDVRSSSIFTIPWTTEDMRNANVPLSLQVNPASLAHGSTEKRIRIQPQMDSGVFSLLIQPSQEGVHNFTVELICQDYVLAERVLNMYAKSHELPPSGPAGVEARVLATARLTTRAVAKAAAIGSGSQ